jgi:hypothetical protein
MRRPDFLRRAAALGCGGRDGTGPPPPASRALRVSCGNGLRPPLTPKTSSGPQGQQGGQPQGGCPGHQRRPYARTRPRRPAAFHPAPERRDTGTRQPPQDTSVHLFDYVNRRKNYKADRRSAAELSLNQSRGAPRPPTSRCGPSSPSWPPRPSCPSPPLSSRCPWNTSTGPAAPPPRPDPRQARNPPPPRQHPQPGRTTSSAATSTRPTAGKRPASATAAPAATRTATGTAPACGAAS